MICLIPVDQETPFNQPSSFDEILNIISRNFQMLDFDVERREGQKTAGQLLWKTKGSNTHTVTQLITGHIDAVWNVGSSKGIPFSIDN